MKEWSTFADGYDCRDCNSCEKEVLQLKSKLDAAQLEISRLRSALEFYADRRVWDECWTEQSEFSGSIYHMTKAFEDRGVTARQALNLNSSKPTGGE